MENKEIIPALYLLPVGLSDALPEDVLPERNLYLMRNIKHFIVENVREARRFLRRCSKEIDIDKLTFVEIHRNADVTHIGEALAPLRRGEAVGLMSDAGCPAVADPGSIVVEIAQREHLKVVPLVGPSSILMSLMASGFNGQGFAFHGYLPIEDGKRKDKIRQLEAQSRREDMTQIFIETPYRNEKMLRTLAESLHPQTKICVACDITSPTAESIVTKSVAEWKKMLSKAGDYSKRPAIFLIYSGR